MKTKTYETTSGLVLTPLTSAENLSVAQIEEVMPYGERQTWGALEGAFANGDDRQLDDALDAFRDLLTSTDQFHQKEAEASVVLAVEAFYRMRLSKQMEIDAIQATAAIQTLEAIRQLIIDEEGKLESYGFELDVIITLLKNGYMAFPASPREERSREHPDVNHDAYMLDCRTGQKVPLQMKLGSASSSRYTHGVRSISRKSSERFAGSFIDYLHQQIPEMAQDKYKYEPLVPSFTVDT